MPGVSGGSFHGLDVGWMQAQWRDCKNKREQLEIFADLTGAKRAEILAVLGAHVPVTPLKGNAPWRTEEEAEIIRMVEEGRTNREIGAALGRSDRAINMRIDLMRKRGIDIPRDRWGGDRLSEKFLKSREEEMEKIQSVTAAEMLRAEKPAPSAPKSAEGAQKQASVELQSELVELPERAEFSLAAVRNQVRELITREAELLESLAQVRREKKEIARELDELLVLVVNGEGAEDGKDQV